MLVEFGHKVAFSLPYFAKTKGVEDGTTTRIIPEVILVFWDIKTSTSISTMIMINNVNNMANNFLKFTCDIFSLIRNLLAK